MGTLYGAEQNQGQQRAAITSRPGSDWSSSVTMTFSAAPHGSTRSKAVRLRRRGTRWLISWAKRSQCSGKVPAICVGTRTALPVTDRLAALQCRWTPLPNRARSVVGEHPGGLNDTGTDAGSVLSAELAGSAPPQADGIMR